MTIQRVVSGPEKCESCVAFEKSRYFCQYYKRIVNLNNLYGMYFGYKNKPQWCELKYCDIIICKEDKNDNNKV